MSDRDNINQKSTLFKYISVPENADVIELQNVYVWKLKTGLYCSVHKDVLEPQTKAEFDFDLNFWKGLKEESGDKIFLISVINPVNKNNKEQRDKAAVFFPETFSAIATVTNSALGKMALAMFLGIKPPQGYLIKVFGDVKRAEDWILPLHAKVFGH